MRKEYPSLSVLKVTKKTPGDFRKYLTDNIEELNKKVSFFEKQLSDFDEELEGMK